MKLVLISEFFYPYKTGTQKILTELAEDLVENGLEIDVLTTDNAYREKKLSLPRNEVYKGVNIKRIYSTAFDRDNKLGRIINYLTFTLSVFWNLLTKKGYDKILFVSNPPLVPYIGYLMKKFRKKEYVYLVHDIYPDVAEKLNVISKDGIVYRVMDKINNKIYSNASKIIALGVDMKKVISNKGIDEDKIDIVTNWADSNNTFEKSVEDEFYNKYNLKDKFNILYTGNISKVHAIDTIIDVARELKSNDKIKFTFVGSGSNKKYLESIIKEEDLDNIQLYDYMFGEEYNNLLNCADMFITTLQKGIEGLGVPSKTYTYMSVSKPIIAIMSEYSEIGNMVKSLNLGKQFNNDEVEEILNYIEHIQKDCNLYDEISSNVRRAFKEKYERKKVTKRFYKVITE